MSAPLYSWDTGTARRPYRWRSRLNLNPIPTSYQAARVRAADYLNLTLRILTRDGTVLFQRAVLSSAPFTLPPVPQDGTLIELEGTSTVHSVEVAPTMMELQA
jgi:hypothetical protein